MNIAVIENGIVENIIVCESTDLAEQLTGKECVAYTDEPAVIGGTYDETGFTPPVEVIPEAEETDGNS